MSGVRQRFDAAIGAAIEEWCEKPFAWGRADCLLSLADIVRAVKGYDPAREFRDRYSTMLGAMRVTRHYGGFAGALACMAIRHQWISIDPKSARIGDVGIIKGTDGPRCGVIKHHKLWVGRSLQGFCAVPAELVDRAWQVR